MGDRDKIGVVHEFEDEAEDVVVEVIRRDHRGDLVFSECDNGLSCLVISRYCVVDAIAMTAATARRQRRRLQRTSALSA